MISSHAARLSLAIAASLILSALNVSANLLQVLPEMGDLSRWAVFSLRGGMSGDHLTDNVLVQGDVGVAGSGNIVIRDNATIDGDLYYRSNGTLREEGNATITGARFNDQDSLLDNSVEEALNASSRAFGLEATRPNTGMSLKGQQSKIISGAPGETVVLKLDYFTLSGNSTLTLQGSATTTFIINVKGQFSLTDNAQIVLSGGVQWNDVLFNVRADGEAVCLSGNSRLEGILMASRGTVQLRGHSTVIGEVIGDRVLLNGNSTVTHPPTASP